MFLSRPERSLNAPSGTPYASPMCCLNRTNACLRTVCTHASMVMEAAEPVSWDALERVHPRAHLDLIRTDRRALNHIFEIPNKEGDDDDYSVTPGYVTHILDPLRYLTQNLILATEWVYERNKSIVMVPDAGQHHASPQNADGSGLFCDVPLAWLKLREAPGRKEQNLKALYVDTDVHHANGFAQARVELGMEEHFFMLDLFNCDIWPFPQPWTMSANLPLATVGYENIPVPFHSGIGTKAYLALLREALDRAALELPKPDLVFYMCSTDALADDPLGKTKVSARGIYQRDRMVVDWARTRGIPIVIMPARGYGNGSCRVARESMARLNDEFHIW